MRFHKSINNENNPLGISPEFFIIHHTGSSAKDENQKKYLNRDDYISCHFNVEKSGKINKLMDLDRIAYHCGFSAWKNFGKNKIKVHNPKTGAPVWLSGMNPFSHGVEINSAGEKFTKAQRKAVIKLCAWWCIKYDKPTSHLLRHKDIAPDRKWDVGPNFFKPYGSWQGFQKEVQEHVDRVRKNFSSIQEFDTVLYVNN